MGARQHVVVGIDGSALSLQAVRWAAREASDRGLTLRVLEVLSSASSRPPATARYFRDALTEMAHRHLSVASTTARHVAEDVEVSEELRLGHPIDVLSGASADAALLVLGHRGSDGVSGLPSGSVAAGVSARASCPVVVTRGRTRQTDAHPLGPVVVGVDGSPASEMALAFAFDAASRAQVRLIAVHAWLDRAMELPTTASLTGWEDMLDEERALLAQRLAGWSEKYPDVATSQIVLRNHPARALVDQSADAQLVVVGAHGRGNLTGRVLGSVSQAVLHRADCPVAVVQSGSDPRPWPAAAGRHTSQHAKGDIDVRTGK